MKPIPILVILSVLAACGQTGESDLSDLQASCEAWVAAEIGVSPSEIQATSTKDDPTGSVTTVTVTGAEAPWLCLADPAGVITGVEYAQEG